MVLMIQIDIVIIRDHFEYFGNTFGKIIKVPRNFNAYSKNERNFWNNQIYIYKLDEFNDISSTIFF